MTESIRAVERALDVLACFSSQSPALSMTQISEQLGINKSTVHRLLATLEARRFVERDPVSSIYKPGPRLVQMAAITLENNALRRLTAPFLHELRDRYRENVNLAILDEAEVVYLDSNESPQRVKLAAALGERLPAFSTASGKAILAFFPEEMVRQILALGMPQWTPSTLVTPDSFLENSRQIREQGFAISEQEYEDGINAVAAPISHPPIASVSIAGPAYRLTRECMLEIGPDLVDTAYQISLKIEMVHGRREPTEV
jgi:IclR family transcriptional regulator, KDG regulon repressor